MNPKDDRTLTEIQTAKQLAARKSEARSQAAAKELVQRIQGEPKPAPDLKEELQKIKDAENEKAQRNAKVRQRLGEKTIGD